ncbi:MAG TPA: hypothetical protein VLD19_05465 [Chitinophagaceae bacterium]|nr:hypothetical protein [Chitinophagaceae bacterium]
MYAINHAATALLLKKKKPALSIWPLLVSVQLVELLWIVFNFIGVEHFIVSGGKIHLDFLPYSHSVFSGVVIALLSFIIIDRGFKNRGLAIAFAIGVLSHIVIDMVFHEKDIRLSPFSDTPAWGLGIIGFPVLNFILELVYGLFCWWYYKGNKALLITIVVFNLLDLPVMLASGTAVNVFKQYPFLLPAFILVQVIITWYFVARYSRRAE